VRILIFHGYLLGGTGSNVYNARLAEALVGLGHEVHLLTQERHPERHRFVDAYGDWDSGALRITPAAGRRGERARCTVYRPDIGGLLPVYVADRYEGIEARTFADCTEAEVERYVDANVRAVRELRRLVRPRLALANHLVMGPLILARGLDGQLPYAVKVHGSALEYTVKREPDRFLEPAREGIAQARAILVGSRHTAESLWKALGDGRLSERTRLGPPGVDVARFAPRDPEAAVAAPRELAARLRASAAQERKDKPEQKDMPERRESEASAFARDELAVADALERLRPEHDELVAFVGKLIVSKGVDLLIAAWPLVLAEVPAGRLAVVGFGAYRGGLERMISALGRGGLSEVREIALAGRSLEDASVGPLPLRHLIAFLDGLTGEDRERYLAAAHALPESIVLTGRLEHDELAELLPSCQALVVPSTFPEAFGMVAAEAAACGVLPISAAHSGLAEVSDVLAGAVPEQAAQWLSFPVDDDAVRALAARLCSWLQADPELRSRTRSGLVDTARERWSWQGVAKGVIAGARGELEGLPSP
jgi:glycosyltransferase involved in cell wall biosynthesis